MKYFCGLLNFTKNGFDHDIIGMHISQFAVSRKLAQVEEQFGEASARLAEFEVAHSALQSSKSKLQCENNDISKQLEEAESKNSSLSKINTNISTKLDETKSELEMEIAVSLFCFTDITSLRCFFC